MKLYIITDALDNYFEGTLGQCIQIETFDGYNEWIIKPKES